jgi:hypothetical protein
VPILAVVTIPTKTDDPADNVQNTFTIDTPILGSDLTQAEELAINGAFSAFYNVSPTGGTGALAVNMSSILDTTALACRLDLYELTGHLDGSPHGSPFSSTLFGLNPVQGASPMPSEMAICVTLEGSGRAEAPVEAPDSGDEGIQIDRPKQRRTGRIYFGPLSTNAMTSTSGVVCRPAAALLTNLRLAVQTLDNALDLAASGIFGLGIWSRADAIVYPIDAVSTDDAFDVQRRRGERPTARTRLDI